MNIKISGLSSIQYTLPTTAWPETNLQIGTAIRDLPDEAETPLHQQYTHELAQAKACFEQAKIDFESDLAKAKATADEARPQIREAKSKKTRAITLFAINVMASVGALATLWTSFPLLAFVAIPLGIALIPVGSYCNEACDKVAKLEANIAAPNRLPRPIWSSPHYNPTNDLDLAKSRIQAQNTLAQYTIAQLAQCAWKKEQITGYALLDHVVVMKEKNRPRFYAKCLDLIHAYGNLTVEHQKFLQETSQAYHQQIQSLDKWRAEAMGEIATMQRQLQRDERTYYATEAAHKLDSSKPNVGFVGSWNLSSQRTAIETKQNKTATKYANDKVAISQWYENRQKKIVQRHKQAQEAIEQEFLNTKALVVRKGVQTSN